MRKVETMVVRRSWKEGFDASELAELSRAVSEATSKQVNIRSVPDEDGEELHITVEEA